MLLITHVYFVYKCDDAFKKEAAMFREREWKLLQENQDLKVRRYKYRHSTLCNIVGIWYKCTIQHLCCTQQLYFVSVWLCG